MTTTTIILLWKKSQRFELEKLGLKGAHLFKLLSEVQPGVRNSSS